MTLKKFLKINTNGDLLCIYIYDSRDIYILRETKIFFLDEEIFLDKTVLSFKVYNEGLYLKLDM